MENNSIFKRKSIRKYLDKDISDDDIKTILSAGMQAPSAFNTQPWTFIVVSDKELISKLSNMSKYSKCAAYANRLILTMVDLEKVPLTRAWFTQDMSACTENILIEATELGIGSVWLGLYPDSKRIEFVSNLFDLPKNIVPFSLVALGYPTMEYESESRYDESKVHYNGF
ncbi:nitroreductase family protein [Methanobrevibacter sp. 87.7]|uniref:nitroreductase family protein n=1 Tax=Methanobrevibacter sp. 87.7 TaxID=387957 RepID=UPI000B4FF86E|nr:nitroreductase family protein [Methanobrevibacter sp. 87.7]OWT32567.1 nitroreductase family protein [Methanobrevibacter sp. 87.7]